MKIGNIEYNVLLMIDKASGEEADCTFADLDEMNSYIRQHKDDPDLAGCKVRYSLVEVSDDGELGAYSWDEEIAFEEFSAEKIQAEIEAQESWLDEVKEITEERDKRMKSFHFLPDAEDYQRKIPLLKDLAYVCPFCVREIEDCRCEMYPYFLMQIDRMILPIVRILNEKGYKTTGCCAGHPDQEEFLSTGIYISFDKDYDMDEPIPEGMHYFKGKHMIRSIPPEDCQDLHAFRQDILRRLTEWAELLSDLHEDEDL